MNIVKYRDILIGDSFFDENIKGRYFVCINYKYIIPIDSVNLDTYIYFEQNAYDVSQLNIPEELTIWFDDNIYPQYTEYEDRNWEEDVFERDNNRYKLLNESIGDLTLDQVRNFRTWWANYILNILVGNPAISTSLNYYAHNKMDDIYISLSQFDYGSVFNINTNTLYQANCNCNSKSISTNIFLPVQNSKCGCGASLSINNSICDAAVAYNSICKDTIIKYFNDENFWTSLSAEDLNILYKYIQAIIDFNLPLYEAVVDQYVDCNDINKQINSQEYRIGLLKSFLETIQYFIDGTYKEHKNKVSKDILNFSILYDIMQWL